MDDPVEAIDGTARTEGRARQRGTVDPPPPEDAFSPDPYQARPHTWTVEHLMPDGVRVDDARPSS